MRPNGAKPLNTEADRQAAIAAGHYKDQDPYANRGPTVFISISFTTKRQFLVIPPQRFYYEVKSGVTTYFRTSRSDLFGHYKKQDIINGKLWGDQSVKNKVQPLVTDPVIRLGELYLNYAEAANEAYGPNKAAPGANMTAIDAINKIRTRVGMPGVKSEIHHIY